MRLTAREIASLTGGDLGGAPSGSTADEVSVEGATTDSRALEPGQLFVAVRAERDGHAFIPAALVAGAPLYLRDHASLEQDAGERSLGRDDPVPWVAVPDTQQALADLGRGVRERLGEAVVGITGSVGKTTVKDLLAAALAPTRRTAASLRSHNNELGVPLTLLNAPDDAEAVVVEMGARGAGHIELLCDIARPMVGVVTAVGLAHTELFGGLEQVVAAKGELVAAVPPEGTVVLNWDQPEVAGMAQRARAEVLAYGLSPHADVVAERVELDDQLRARFRLRSPWGQAAVAVPLAGAHQVSNALAAAAVALSLGSSPDEVAQGLAGAVGSPWRMVLGRRADGLQVLNDAYNANPTSVVAALEALAALPAERRIAVLGTMAELGAEHERSHREVLERARALGIEVVAVQEPEYGTGARHVGSREEASALLEDLGGGDAVLVKGSRVAGLEVLAEHLLAESVP